MLDKIKKFYFIYSILIMILSCYVIPSVFWLISYIICLIFHGLYNPYKEINIKIYKFRFILPTILSLFFIILFKFLF